MNFRWKTSTPILVAFMLAASAVPVAWGHVPMPPKKGEIGRQEVQTPIPDFTLTDQDNRRFRFSSTRGKLVLITFVFTTCTDICPLFTAKFATIQRKLAEQKRPEHRLLVITTDPERDTPAALKTYAKSYNVDLNHWSFLTGSEQELRQVWKAFGVNVTKFRSGQIQHTGLAALIDHQGIRRVNYWGDKWLESDVLKDISRLTPETKGEHKPSH